MIGAFAVFGYEVYFNEVVHKPNLSICEIPAENWLHGDADEMIYPLSSMGAGLPPMLNCLENNEYPSPLEFPPVVGISITFRGTLREVAFSKRKLVWRPVPQGKGVIYTRGEFSDFEDTMHAALKLTGNLREAVALAGKACLTVAGKPIFTTLGVVAWAIWKKDMSLIRTLTAFDVMTLIGGELGKEDIEKDLKSDLMALAAIAWKSLTEKEMADLNAIKDKRMKEKAKAQAAAKRAKPEVKSVNPKVRRK